MYQTSIRKDTTFCLCCAIDVFSAIRRCKVRL